MFLLDTDHITIIQWQTQPGYDRLVKRMDPLSDFFFPIVSFHEQALGANAYISKATDATRIVRGTAYFRRLLRALPKPRFFP